MLQFVTEAVSIGIVETIAIAIQVGISINAVSAVVGGFIIVVAGRCIGATRDFKFITNVISIFIIHTRAIAVVWEGGVRAGAVVKLCTGIVVASLQICAAKGQTRNEIARVVIHGGCRVVVASEGAGAAQDFLVITNTIGVVVRSAIASTNAKGIKLIAITIAVALHDESASAVVEFSFVVIVAGL